EPPTAEDSHAAPGDSRRAHEVRLTAARAKFADVDLIASAGNQTDDRSQPTSVGHETPGRELLFSRVLGRRFLDHRSDHRIVGRDPIRREIPFLAVPGLDTAHSRALMVGARDFDRLQLVLEPELLQPFRSQIEVFEAPPDLLAGERLLAEPLLRGADRLHA